MQNPFSEIVEKLTEISQKLDKIEGLKEAPSRIPLRQFCESRGITRPTAYAWANRGLLQLEKLGGRQFVLANSIRIVAKYERP